MATRKIVLVTAFLLLIQFKSSGIGRPVSIGTNIVEIVNLGGMNTNVGVGISRHWSGHLWGSYNPWNWHKGDNLHYNKKLHLKGGARWWSWYLFSGWYVGGAIDYEIYNRKLFHKDVLQQGSSIGGCIEFGYALMLEEHLNIEFGWGIRCGVTDFRKYRNIPCGELLDRGKKGYILPDTITISLTYIF